MDVHKITEILKFLQEDPRTNLSDLVKVELQYLALLDGQHRGLLKTLETELATDAVFFSQVISVCYRPEGEARSAHEPSEKERAAALNAYRLVNGWRIPPGTQRDGTFSSDAFEEWLSQVKDILR